MFRICDMTYGASIENLLSYVKLESKKQYKTHSPKRNMKFGSRKAKTTIIFPKPSFQNYQKLPAEAGGFEPPVPQSGTAVFETAPFNHSGTLPF